MALNTKALEAQVATVGITLDQAKTIIAATITLVNLVQDLYDGLSGKDKLAAVLAGVATTIDQLGVGEKLDAIQKVLGPLVSVIVSVFHAKNLWTKITDAVQSLTHG